MTAKKNNDNKKQETASPGTSAIQLETSSNKKDDKPGKTARISIPEKKKGSSGPEEKDFID